MQLPPKSFPWLIRQGQFPNQVQWQQDPEVLCLCTSWSLVINNQVVMSHPTCTRRSGYMATAWVFSSHLFFFFFGQAVCGSQFPNQGLNPGPQQWKHQVLTTGLPGNSLSSRFLQKENFAFPDISWVGNCHLLSTNYMLCQIISLNFPTILRDKYYHQRLYAFNPTWGGQLAVQGLPTWPAFHKVLEQPHKVLSGSLGSPRFYLQLVCSMYKLLLALEWTDFLLRKERDATCEALGHWWQKRRKRNPWEKWKRGTVMGEAPECYFGKSQKTTWESVRSLAQYPLLRV